MIYEQSKNELNVIDAYQSGVDKVKTKIVVLARAV